MSEKNIAFFDIDKTIYDTPVFMPLAEFQFNNKIIEASCLSTLKRDIGQYKTGNVSYEEVVRRINIHWAEGLKGKNTRNVLVNSKEYFSGNMTHFYPFVKEVFDALKPTYDIYLVTGEPDFVAKSVVDLFSLTGYIASTLSVNDNIYTGKAEIILSAGVDKLHALKGTIDRYTRTQSLAFGDSEGDIEMLSCVEIPVCINPSDKLRVIATNNHWHIVSPDEVQSLVKELLSK